jgi:glycosyltransferase involved in cell wall biosynthesis
MISLPIIITLGVLLLLGIIAPLFSPFSRKVEEEEVASGSDNGASLPPVSIVLAEHDCYHYLERVLPHYLTQEYPADYQVVVVIDQSDVKSEDYLKLMSEKYPHLYYTMLPDSSLYVSRKKLGLTLGIRAAKYEWLLFADVNCKPSSNEWLAAVARHCTDDNNMVLGMTPYEEDTPTYYRFEHLRTMLYHLRSAQRGMAFSTNQSMMMMRRSEFFEQRGFSGNLEFARAEYEFLVNKFAKEDKCAIAIEPEAWMEQFEPAEEYMRMKRLYALDALKGLDRSAKFKSMYKIDLYMMHLFNILSFIAVCIGVLLTAMQYELLQIPGQADILKVFGTIDGVTLLGGSLFCWIISLVERCCLYSSKLEYFNSIGSFAAVLYEWTISIRNMFLRISYMSADKNDFITHKL